MDMPPADTPADLPPLGAGLYIVATPIGNLSDLSPRAADVLRRAALIACEDTRVTAKLLRHVGSSAPMTPYHDHNGARVRPGLIARAAAAPVALVSDAGTPLISDPGYKLVREARAAGVAIVTLPGPCAAIAALTLAGLPSDRFLFAGFLPAKAGARRRSLAALAAIDATLVLYESGPRVAETLDLIEAELPGRETVLVREISKRHETTVALGTLGLADRFRDAPPKGEIVLVIAPPLAAEPASDTDQEAALLDALTRLSPAKAAGEVARALGGDRKALYRRAMELKNQPR